MKLLTLNLKNFKGKTFSLDTQGRNVSIFGDNEAGKTTLADAFLWLLFGKDSQSRADFEIKNLDENNNPIHGLEHEVESSLEKAEGHRITLKKSYKEQWTKKRGSTKPTFSGHTTDYYIDDVPVKKKDFVVRVDMIAPEDIFKLLTSPSYFNTQLHWERRREILLEVCGDISDQEVIASTKTLANLPDILNGRKLEDHKKVIAGRRREINKELEKVPVRISEVQQNLPDISGLNVNDLQDDLARLRAQQKEKNEELSRIVSGGEVAEKTKALREIESDLLDIKRKAQGEIDNKVSKKRDTLATAKDHFFNLEVERAGLAGKLRSNEDRIAWLRNRMSSLRSRWHEIDKREFTFEQDDACPTCGQALPEEQLQQARYNAQADFNRAKADQLEDNVAQGKQYKTETDELVDEVTKLEEKIAKMDKDIVKHEADARSLQEEIDAIRQDATSFETDPTYIAKREEKAALEGEITTLQDGTREAAKKVEDELYAFTEDIGMFERGIAAVDQYKRGQERIKELEKQEKVLAKEFEKLEEELYLTEEFTRTKVSLLEDKINSKFRFARFKLFDTQINEGLKECCETLYKGIPYNSNLNAGHRIIVGMDIIKTLSEHYKFVAPIFVDNAESVTRLPEMEAQVIRLVKPEIETEEERKKYSKLNVVVD